MINHNHHNKSLSLIIGINDNNNHLHHQIITELPHTFLTVVCQLRLLLFLKLVTLQWMRMTLWTNGNVKVRQKSHKPIGETVNISTDASLFRESGTSAPTTFC